MLMIGVYHWGISVWDDDLDWMCILDKKRKRGVVAQNYSI